MKLDDVNDKVKLHQIRFDRSALLTAEDQSKQIYNRFIECKQKYGLNPELVRGLSIYNYSLYHLTHGVAQMKYAELNLKPKLLSIARVCGWIRSKAKNVELATSCLRLNSDACSSRNSFTQSFGTNKLENEGGMH